MFLGKKMEEPDPDSPYKANAIAASRRGLPIPGQLRDRVQCLPAVGPGGA
jgi:hypothetical protein